MRYGLEIENVIIFRMHLVSFCFDLLNISLEIDKKLIVLFN